MHLYLLSLSENRIKEVQPEWTLKN
jgi:hypothetical protein